MLLLKSFKLTKTKFLILAAIGVIVIIVDELASYEILCFVSPCPEFPFTRIAQEIDSLLTFNRFFVNTKLALNIKNLLLPYFLPRTTYSILSLISSLAIYYLILSLWSYFYSRFKKQ